MKYLCIGCGVLLLLGIPSGWAYGYYVFLRWTVFLSSIYLVYTSYQNKPNGWVFVFGVIAFMFNPLFPIYLSKDSWVGIDFLSSIFFFVVSTRKNEITK